MAGNQSICQRCILTQEDCTELPSEGERWEARSPDLPELPEFKSQLRRSMFMVRSFRLYDSAFNLQQDQAFMVRC